MWIKQTLFVLSNRDNPSGSVNLTGAMPLFDGGALEGQVEVRTAEQQRAIAEYAGIALKAFNEVESALAAEAALRDRVPLLERIVFESGRSLELSGVQYRVGKIDLRNVLNDELRLYSARSQLLRLQSERVVQRINLYLALGGGVWCDDAMTPPTRDSLHNPHCAIPAQAGIQVDQPFWMPACAGMTVLQTFPGKRLP
jgi:outer membrane protein TolC